MAVTTRNRAETGPEFSIGRFLRDTYDELRKVVWPTWGELYRYTLVVTSFVGSANSPVPLQEKEVRAIQKQMKQEAPKIRVEFAVGESVRVVDGPFTDFHGKVDEINPEKGKLKVLVNMFGRETPVELDLLQVEKVH